MDENLEKLAVSHFSIWHACGGKEKGLLSSVLFPASFLKIVKNRLFSLLKKQEENPFNLKDWVLREAANLNALQEAGTFRYGQQLGTLPLGSFLKIPSVYMVMIAEKARSCALNIGSI